MWLFQNGNYIANTRDYNFPSNNFRRDQNFNQQYDNDSCFDHGFNRPNSTENFLNFNTTCWIDENFVSDNEEELCTPFTDRKLKDVQPGFIIHNAYLFMSAIRGGQSYLNNNNTREITYLR